MMFFRRIVNLIVYNFIINSFIDLLTLYEHSDLLDRQLIEMNQIKLVLIQKLSLPVFPNLNSGKKLFLKHQPKF